MFDLLPFGVTLMKQTHFHIIKTMTNLSRWARQDSALTPLSVQPQNGGHDKFQHPSPTTPHPSAPPANPGAGTESVLSNGGERGRLAER